MSYNTTNIYKNYLLNSGFDFCQRKNGSSNFSAQGYYCDRWFKFGTNTNIEHKVPGALFEPIDSYSTLAFKGGPTGNQALYSQIVQTLEEKVTRELVGDSVTFSIGINFGVLSSAPTPDWIRLKILHGTSGTEQVNLSSVLATQTFTPPYRNDGTAYVPTGFRYSVTAFVPKGTINLSVSVEIKITSTDPAAVICQLSHAQLNKGSSPSTWSLANGSLSAELLACQRYYEKSFASDTAIIPSTRTYGEHVFYSYGKGSLGLCKFNAEKRIIPAVTLYDDELVINRWKFIDTGNTDPGYLYDTFTPTLNITKNSINASSATALATNPVLISGHWVADAEIPYV